MPHIHNFDSIISVIMNINFTNGINQLTWKKGTMEELVFIQMNYFKNSPVLWTFR